MTIKASLPEDPKQDLWSVDGLSYYYYDYEGGHYRLDGPKGYALTFSSIIHKHFESGVSTIPPTPTVGHKIRSELELFILPDMSVVAATGLWPLTKTQNLFASSIDGNYYNSSTLFESEDDWYVLRVGPDYVNN